MRYLFICLTAILFACHSSTNQPTEEKTMSIDSLIVQHPDSSTASALPDGVDTNCVRATPKSVIKKNIFPKSTFQLQPDKLTGIETVELDNEDKLIIKNWGCEYYSLTFRFETNRFQNEPGNVGFWYKRAVTLMNEVAKGIDSPFQVEKATEAVVERIEQDVPNGYKNLKYKDEIDYGPGEIREFVTIDNVEQLSDKRFAVEITISTGPL